jgi:hypothetical protein
MKHKARDADEEMESWAIRNLFFSFSIFPFLVELKVFDWIVEFDVGFALNFFMSLHQFNHHIRHLSFKFAYGIAQIV